MVPLPLAERGRLGLALGRAFSGGDAACAMDSAASVLRCLDLLAAAARAGVPVRVRAPFGGEAGPAIDPPVVAALTAAGVAVRFVGQTDDPAAFADEAGPVVVLHRRSAQPPVPAAPDRPMVVLASLGANDACVDAAEALAADGVDAAVVPLDRPAPSDALVDAARRCGRVIVVAHDGGDVVVHALIQPAFWWFEAAPVAVAPRVTDILAAARAAIES
jgi:hypothetical protein